MPLDQTARDEKNNYVTVTLFETYLARFTLENPAFYKDIYCKLIDGIRRLTQEDPSVNPILKSFLYGKPPGFDLPRYMYTVFSRVNSAYPGHDSFELLISNFNLLTSHYFIKIIADELLNMTTRSPFRTIGASPAAACDSPYPGFFTPIVSESRSPYNPNRCADLFSEKNRGVIAIESTQEDDLEDASTLDLGIVSQSWAPSNIQNYFDSPVYSARFNYKPNEISYVAKWLRNRHLPVISGSSGSAEILFTRVLPLVSLSDEELKMVLFAEACSMVAIGHHSLFESFLVADYFGHFILDTDTLLNFYLQVIPEKIRANAQFDAFYNGPLIAPLLMGMPLIDSGLATTAEAAALASIDTDSHGTTLRI